MKTELKKLLTAESTDVDFKVSLEKAKPKSWLKTVVAFSNGIGGSILFGVDDERHIIGLSHVVNFHIISDWFNHNKTDRNVRKTVKIMAG